MKTYGTDLSRTCAMESICVPTISRNSYDARTTILEELIKSFCIETSWSRLSTRSSDGETLERRMRRVEIEIEIEKTNTPTIATA